jgi:hypothetical protein
MAYQKRKPKKAIQYNGQNENGQIEEGHTIQWPRENGQIEEGHTIQNVLSLQILSMTLPDLLLL